MQTCTIEKMTALINEKFGGKLSAGSHSESDGACCILEAVNVCRGNGMTDDRTKAGMPDIRSINDIQVPDELRTEWMLRLYASLQWWESADESKRERFTGRVAVLTVNRLIAELPRLTDSVRQQCRDAKTVSEARAAAHAAAASYAAYAACASYASYASYAADAADAAYAAAHAAHAAAYDAYADARSAIFLTTVKLWIEASEATK